MIRLLVVDDDAAVTAFLREMLEDHGWHVEAHTSPEAALQRIRAEAFDVVVSDVEMPGLRGTELLAAILEARPGQLVILITAFGTVDLAVRALRAGACDFVTKPFDIETLIHVVERALREREMRREIVRLRSQVVPADGELVARSPAMRRVLELARRAAVTDATVLLTGESGVGKGAVARYIHAHGPRAEGPLLEVNCAALPAQLVESELFGVRRGAFTDAHRDRPGLFVQAHGGTIFLDEIGEMPLEMQPKLLHALETGRVRAVGSAQDQPTDVRIIAATNRMLEEALRDRTFRPDLYYRLNVIRIDIPPLRDRAEDIEPLVETFVQSAARRFDREVVGLARSAWRWLLRHSWPGNVRELANAIERAVALAQHDTLVLEDIAPPGVVDDRPADTFRLDLEEPAPLEEIERRYIAHVLDRVDGNKTQAARILGIDRRTLYRKLEPEGD